MLVLNTVSGRYLLGGVFDTPDARDVSFCRCRFFSGLDQIQLSRDVVQRINGRYDNLDLVRLKRGGKSANISVVDSDGPGSSDIFGLGNI
jgi:hypothetical protein